jgi:single-stranded-DNA-specific exonuclease
VRNAVEAGILVKGGGHAMAAGLTVEKGRIAALRDFFDTAAASKVARLSQAHALEIDGALSAGGATLDLVDQLEGAGPYGAGHPQPVFAFPRHRLSDARVVGANHVRLSIAAPGGGKLDGIAFRAAETELGNALLSGRGLEFHFAGCLTADHWQGNRRVQLRLLDAAPAK